MNIIYPPDKVPDMHTEPMVFLAGSIEMGKAEDWQKVVEEAFKDSPVTFLNPRRPNWDSSWKQGPNEEPFRSQVLWELSGIGKSNIVFFYFCGGTISPISLLELGLCLNEPNKRIVVCCPPEFHRYANVKITCEVNGTIVFDKLEEAVDNLRETIRKIT